MHVNEIFTSLSGECDGFSNQGGLATFVRLQGCNLKCKWCDTRYSAAFHDWEDMSVDAIVKACTTQHIIITGGEPLLQQEEVAQLVDKLIIRNSRQRITIETNGSIPITIDSYKHLRFVVDYKLDSSGMNSTMLPEVFASLHPLDVIKFVINDLQDYQQAKDMLLRNPQWHAKKVFSPVPKKTWPAKLAKAMVQDKLENVCLSMQLHKVLKIK